ncbi:TPR domain protein, putative component of TonB system [Chitinispirillum alkaliphilum]|nr:TPR domain protein, putative component of TonB system [Chitinispirillum alkaliphilum]
MCKKLFLILFLTAVCAASSQHQPTVSVLYFNNLSPENEHPNLGKALAEILISDLSANTSLLFVEREQLEKIMREIALGQTGAVDMESAPEVGNLLGAQYLLTGTYMLDRRSVVVTLRLIHSEQGTIVGSGRVRGRRNNFRRLLQRVSTEASDITAKLAPHTGTASPLPSNPDITLETAVQYGNALDRKDNGDLPGAEAVLSSILSVSPEFHYANISLEQVRQRIREASERHDDVIDSIRGTGTTIMQFNQVASNYMSQMQFRELFAYCLEVRDNPPSSPQGSGMNVLEIVDYYLLTAASNLRKWDFVITHGDAFLQNNPGSPYFPHVRTQVRMAARQYEREQEREKSLLSEFAHYKEIGKYNGDESHIYRYMVGARLMDNQLYERALEYLRDIDHTRPEFLAENIRPEEVLFKRFMCFYHNFDRAGASTVYDILVTQYPDTPILSALEPIMDFFGD